MNIACLHLTAAYLFRAADLASLNTRIEIIRRLYAFADGTPDLPGFVRELRECEALARAHGAPKMAEVLRKGRTLAALHCVERFGVAA